VLQKEIGASDRDHRICGMCGIAGYSLSSSSSVERTLAAQALLAGIAERGADATGYAFRGLGSRVTIAKQRTGASKLLESLRIPAAASEVLVHVRDYTKGHPTIEANNHPIRHGSVVGIHNGIVENDDALFDAHGWRRAHPAMTVDSEAIFALAEERRSDPLALEELRGAMAAAWLDERDEGVTHLARSVGRPLWIGHRSGEVYFASTRHALELVERTLRMTLRKQELGEGRVLRLRDGRIEKQLKFQPDRGYCEQHALPSVRAPHEGASGIARLAAIAAAA
jgi:glucosamine 6-phosphate synthetase-like amidotransferase/phosphosugar isomerase protein